MEEVKNDYPTLKLEEEQKAEGQKIDLPKNEGNKDETIVECINPKEISGHTVYNVRLVVQNEETIVQRRFNDFYTFRQVLQNKWPGNFVPPIPPKKTMGNMDQAFIEERRQDLDYFLKSLLQLPHLWNSEETNQFLKGSDVEKLNLLGKVDYQQLVEKYAKSYDFLQGKELSGDIVEKISLFQNFLKIAAISLESYKPIAKQVIDGHNGYYDTLSTFLGFTLPQYEENCLKMYLSSNDEKKLIIGQDNNETLQDLRKAVLDSKSESEYETLYNTLKTELREIESMQEVYEQRAQYEATKKKYEQKLSELNLEKSKAEMGQLGIQAKISNKPKEKVIEELAKDIQTTESIISNLKVICDSISAILGYVEIDRFKKNRLGIYYQIQKKVAQAEIKHEQTMLKFWQFVSENSNLN